jgi:hypothetical protein
MTRCVLGKKNRKWKMGLRNRWEVDEPKERGNAALIYPIFGSLVEKQKPNKPKTPTLARSSYLLNYDPHHIDQMMELGYAAAAKGRPDP